MSAARLIAVSGLGAKEPAAFVVETAEHRLPLNPRRVIPPFGDPRFYLLWRARLAPREVLTSKTVDL